MAMAGVKFCRGEEEMDERYVTQLQALLRGYLMRRNLQLVRDEYEEIFSEIEGSEKIFVCWPLHSLCLPKTQKDRPTKNVSHGSLISDHHPKAEKDICEPRKAVSPVQDLEDNFDLSVQKEKTNIQEKCTAETQTSFIEDLNLKLSLGSSLTSQKTDDDQDQRMLVKDNMYTSSREDSFHSGAEEVPDIVQQTFDDSSMKLIHPSCAYDEKSGHPQKSPDSSGGFEHSAKTSGSRSSSGRSQIKGSMIISEITEVNKSNRSEADSNRPHRSGQSVEKDDRSEVKSDRSNVSSGQSSIKSERSEVKSNRSNVSSGHSVEKDDRSEVKSDRSNISSDRSGVKYQSKVKLDRSKVRSDKSAASKSEGHPHIEEREQSPESMTPRRYMRESSVLTNATSVWDSFSSTTGYIPSTEPDTITDDPDTLMEVRKNIAMELLWVQQAINSRKNYLKIKGQMKIPMSST